MGAVRVTWRQAVRWRTRRQLLVEPARDAVEVARRLCGLHAQVASCAGLIARIRCAAPPGLDAALWADRSLVRTWAMRGTLHLLPADELHLWVAALTDRESRRRFPPSWERAHGVTPLQLHAITAAVGEVLGATPLTRAELAAAVCAHLGDPGLADALAVGWGALLKPAAARGLLCSGPAVDGNVTFVAPAAWLGRPIEPIDPAAANREVLRRFLAANGPATAADVARWWGEQPAPAKRWIREYADALAPVEVDGEGGFVVRAEDADELAATPAEAASDPADVISPAAAASDPADVISPAEAASDPADGPFLLPGFDPWVIAPLSHRTRAIPAGRESAVSRTAGWISPVLVVDGAVAGVWERTDEAITVRTFEPQPETVRREAERYARRYATAEAPPSVDWRLA